MTLKHILIIDDSESICEVIQLTMQLDGYDTTIRTTGKNAYEFIASSQPDLILLDIMLDGYDGRDICKQVKGSETTSHIPIIMVSASHDLKGVAKEITPPDYFLAKPFDIYTLSEIVEKHVFKPRKI